MCLLPDSASLAAQESHVRELEIIMFYRAFLLYYPDAQAQIE